ncbi:MAG: hypothetical protein KA758_02775 [Acidimicrobiales bacterium]|nr:hypothetical protein [Acidimicrobiales bacterium]
MGTNYYMGSNRCDCCNRYDQGDHICKSLRSFHAPTTAHITHEGNSWRHDGWVIFPSSWAEWKQHLRTQPEGHAVVDEYGRWMGVEEFIAAVEAQAVKDREMGIERQHEWMLKHSDHRHEVSDGPARWCTWADPDEGFSFTAREFS